jgi:hypothetical protein
MRGDVKEDEAGMVMTARHENGDAPRSKPEPTRCGSCFSFA